MSQAYRHVLQLAETIGPRGSCTEAERKAAHYIKTELGRSKLNLMEEQFKAVSSFSWVFGLIDLLFIVAALIFPSRPKPGFFLALFAFIAFILESSTFPFLSRLLPKKSSQNVIAHIPARSKPIRKVIITAHYDSSRSALNFSPKLVKGFRRSYLLLVGAMASEVFLYALAVFTSLSPRLLWFLSLPCVLYILVTFLTLLHRNLPESILRRQR